MISTGAPERVSTLPSNAGGTSVNVELKTNTHFFVRSLLETQYFFRYSAP